MLSEPFLGTLRLGLLSTYRGEGTWLEESDVGEVDDAMKRARQNLKDRARKPLREVEPGVWQSEWADWFAASRLATPEQFTSLPTKGAPVAFAP